MKPKTILIATICALQAAAISFYMSAEGFSATLSYVSGPVFAALYLSLIVLYKWVGEAKKR